MQKETQLKSLVHTMLSSFQEPILKNIFQWLFTNNVLVKLELQTRKAHFQGITHF